MCARGARGDGSSSTVVVVSASVLVGLVVVAALASLLTYERGAPATTTATLVSSDGLPVSVWSAPGAAAGTGYRIRTYPAGMPIPIEVVRATETAWGTAYVLIRLPDGREGWVGALNVHRAP